MCVTWVDQHSLAASQLRFSYCAVAQQPTHPLSRGERGVCFFGRFAPAASNTFASLPRVNLLDLLIVQGVRHSLLFPECNVPAKARVDQPGFCKTGSVR